MMTSSPAAAAAADDTDIDIAFDTGTADWAAHTASPRQRVCRILQTPASTIDDSNRERQCAEN